jgi:hypothetical protein
VEVAANVMGEMTSTRLELPFVASLWISMRSRLDNNGLRIADAHTTTQVANCCAGTVRVLNIADNRPRTRNIAGQERYWA